MSVESEQYRVVTVVGVTPDNLSECMQLCPSYHSDLFRRFCASEWFAGFALESEGSIVGLVFGLGNHTSSFWVKVLNFVPEFSASEYVRKLLTALVDNLRSRDYNQIYAYFTRHDGESADYLEREYEKFGFEPPVVYKKVYKLPYSGLEKTGLLRLELPEWAEVVKYADLDKKHWDLLKSGDIRFTEDLSPFVSGYDPETSIFLLNEGDIVGWNIARRINADVVYFVTLFVVDDYRASPVGIQLLAESLRRYLENPENKYGLFGARPDNKELYRFIEKRFGRHCTDIAVDYEVVYWL